MLQLEQLAAEAVDGGRGVERHGGDGALGQSERGGVLGEGRERERSCTEDSPMDARHVGGQAEE